MCRCPTDVLTLQRAGKTLHMIDSGAQTGPPQVSSTSPPPSRMARLSGPLLSLLPVPQPQVDRGGRSVPLPASCLPRPPSSLAVSEKGTWQDDRPQQRFEDPGRQPWPVFCQTPYMEYCTEFKPQPYEIEANYLQATHETSAPEKFSEVTQTTRLHYDHKASCESLTEVQAVSGASGHQRWVFIHLEFRQTSYISTASPQKY